MFIPQCHVTFHGVLEDLEPVTLQAFHVRDVLNGCNSVYKEFNRRIYEMYGRGYQFLITVNGEFKRCESEFTECFTQPTNEIEIASLVEFAGKGILGIVAGVGLLALSFSGVGILGISATTFGLLGRSLLFSDIFGTPPAKNPKSSVNFGGVVNVVAGSSPVPIVAGRGVWIGSVVVGAEITPITESLT